MAAVNITREILHRQIRDRRAPGFQRSFHVTDPFIKRLGLETELQGHTGCVNCLEWNEQGDLLASGSDDQHVIIWDPFRHKKLTTMHTGHAANIFSVKFLPHTGDRILVTGAADTKVHVHDLTVKETIHMFSDHTNRVKRIATAPMWPNTFWSAAEDGIIRQYDLRENSKHSEVLIDLTEFCGQLAEAKCLAVNPRDNNYLAVGANGPFVRLYDIRMIHNYRKSLSQNTSAAVHTFCDRQKPIPDGAGQYYVAGHLPVKLRDYNNRLRVLVATYVTFSPDGTELLVNMGGEQVYLFDLTFKQRPYTFVLPKMCQSTTDVQNGKTTNGVSNGIHLPPGHIRFTESKTQSSFTELPPHLEKIKQQANNAFARQQWTQAIQLYSLGIHEARGNAMLYGNRAAAYMKRKWDGDHYDALRDCVKALALNPGHLKAHFRLARCLFELKYVAEALECLDDFKGKFPEQAHSSACDALDKDIKAALYSKSDSEDKKGNSSIRFQSFSRKESIPEDEVVLRECSFDYKHRYCGHCNTTTDIKEANFFGSKGQYIVSGSDDGSFFIWEKETTNLVRILQGDESIVNCLQPHPSYCFLATSGIDPVVRLWNPRPETDGDNGRVVEDMEGAAQANQRRMNADPLEVMLLNMGYRITGLRGVGPDGSDDEDSSEGPVQCRTS
ncbi:WD and tetratricopeptide repeats protein 1 [Gambusia affinis]|uniref:WD and tetratricopeptide repeats protein 1 n=1 Tax=Gambusia affinis TaxID=33528 RepID=UPI000F34B59C|nr:WD and tetratricopeptide repeats protein 1 [Gambusia affinis]XP_043972402.1 WD and tetratricopeptide repeats protein 1 [Gambusia affinis]XP_043972403.1 WD and tetratricopeptide repeats protein 1 [Gambusia affinis]XP_043972404.1 WD and tetratricopeptide repeats protein 1 [Gambusia affinis]XP_043972405.1 WD and tetratricopeptide repeats protein 1 [Gambusia affinis]XP_043972406.1 WD and tetratricopeptide repeats protein 1 [Gambusia affinis]XP_043972407.1 WD and tetratricopeptide repeats prote